MMKAEMRIETATIRHTELTADMMPNSTWELRTSQLPSPVASSCSLG